VDFAVAPFAAGAGPPVRIVLDEASRGLAQSLGGRWKKPPGEIHVLEGGFDGLGRILEKESAEVLVLSSLSSVMLLEAAALLDLPSAGRREVAKISLEKTPVETYVTRRDHLLELLEVHGPRVRRLARSKEYLFEGVLFSSIDLIEDVPGELLFQNDLMDFYRRNLWLAAHSRSREYCRAAARMPELSDSLTESRISESGHLKDSYIAAGAEIDGYVEGSVIFPNVVVRQKARVVNSIIATNNRIGAECTIQNAVILPYGGEGSRGAPNIGDGCSIGGRSTSAANELFPEQIRDGLTVIGMNVSVPNGFRAEAGSYIGPAVTASMLRKQKSLRRGGCFLEDGERWTSGA
jgi:hypothetical protein